MKRRLIILFALTMMMIPVVDAQMEFGVRAGLNLQNLNGEDINGDKLKNKLTPGFHAGVEVGFPIAPDFYLQPGLLFSTKGATDLSGTQDLTARLSYIELPIHLAYKPQLGTGKLILGFGPYVAYGITGKLTLDGDEEDIKFTNDITESSDGLFFLRPLDAGADIFFGYEFAFGFFAQVNAQLGLLNLIPKFDGETSDAITKNTGFGVSLGYRF